jgi:RNA polymerase sigma factor (sigma-70 family)
MSVYALGKGVLAIPSPDEQVSFVRRLVASMHHRIPANVLYDDVVAEGLLALVLAARRFDDGRSAAFRTYAYPAVRGSVLNFLAKESKHRHIVSDYDHAYHHTPERIAMQREKLARFLDAVAGLSDPRRHAVVVALAGRTATEGARLLNTSEQRVRCNKRAAVQELRELLHAA